MDLRIIGRNFYSKTNIHGSVFQYDEEYFIELLSIVCLHIYTSYKFYNVLQYTRPDNH